MLTCEYAFCSGVLVKQIPYEAALIRNDLLPQTLSQYQAQLREAEERPDSSPAEGRSEEWFPDWYPATYDLATEVQFFVKHFREVRR